jgi:hypothetical protein
MPARQAQSAWRQTENEQLADLSKSLSATAAVIISEAIRIVKWCIASSPIGTSVGSYLFDSEVELAWSAGRELPGNDSLFCFAFSKNCNKLCGKVMCHDIVITNYT